jgi:Tfp pilus assembly protein PilO
MQLSLRDVLLASVSIGLLAGAWAMVVRPHQLARQQRENELAAVQSDLSSLRIDAPRSTALARQVESQRLRQAEFHAMLPALSDQRKAIDEVVQTAAANSLQTQDVQALSREMTGSIAGVPVLFRFAGSFNAFYAFVLELEAMHRPMRVRNLSLRGGSTSGICAELRVILFFDASASDQAKL